jgi:hypothetical protein
MALDGDEDTSLRDVLADRVTRLDIDDPALLANINTPAQWKMMGQDRNEESGFAGHQDQ